MIPKIQRKFLPKLKHPDFKKSFEIYTDASDHTIAGAVFQSHGVIGFYSKKLSESESLYPIQEKETLAVVRTASHFRHILLGSPIILRTDNRNLLSKKTTANKRTSRWLLILQEYEIRIEFLKGNSNFVADFLSRTNLISCKENSKKLWDLKKIEEVQNSDTLIQNKVASSEYKKCNFENFFLIILQQN